MFSDGVSGLVTSGVRIGLGWSCDKYVDCVEVYRLYIVDIKCMVEKRKVYIHLLLYSMYRNGKAPGQRLIQEVAFMARVPKLA